VYDNRNEKVVSAVDSPAAVVRRITNGSNAATADIAMNAAWVSCRPKVCENGFGEPVCRA